MCPGAIVPNPVPNLISGAWCRDAPHRGVAGGDASGTRRLQISDRQAEGIHLVRQRRDQGNQILGFNSRPFVLCGLPLRRPPKDQLLYERRNGSFVLQVTGHPEFGLPLGQDRLVPIFLATMAVLQQSKTIRFKSASVMLETFGMAKGGKEYRRLVAASSGFSGRPCSSVPKR